MNKLFLFCAVLLCCAAPASAQTARYRFDNFDTREGVRVEIPAPVLTGKQSKKAKPVARRIEAARAGVVQPTAAVYERPRGVEMTAGKSLDGFSTGDSNVDAMIADSGRRNGVDPVLLYAIMHRESSFKKFAVSNKGARGLMQLMPGTAARFGVKNIFDPRQNIEAGARYIRILLNMFDGDVRLALAGYNAGEGAVLKYGRRVPPYSETQEYVRRISQRYALMRDPETARRAPVVSRAQVATLKTNEKSMAGNLYEQSVYAVRMPDGKLRLVSQ
jgi:hypothetical protein